jgi:hypothetical protein
LLLDTSELLLDTPELLLDGGRELQKKLELLEISFNNPKYAALSLSVDAIDADREIVWLLFMGNEFDIFAIKYYLINNI